jgi:hypothetical protein
MTAMTQIPDDSLGGKGCVELGGRCVGLTPLGRDRPSFFSMVEVREDRHLRH